jgi:hypothetical protein
LLPSRSPGRLDHLTISRRHRTTATRHHLDFACRRYYSTSDIPIQLQIRTPSNSQCSANEFFHILDICPSVPTSCDFKTRALAATTTTTTYNYTAMAGAHLLLDNHIDDLLYDSNSVTLAPPSPETDNSQTMDTDHHGLLQDNRGLVSPQVGKFATVAKLSATQTTIVTTTTTTTTSIPPLLLRPPRHLHDRDPKHYPLAASPIPAALKNFSFNYNGQTTLVQEEDVLEGSYSPVSIYSGPFRVFGTTGSFWYRLTLARLPHSLALCAQGTQNGHEHSPENFTNVYPI